MTKLTPSEARAEAVTIVLQILLRSRLSDDEHARTYATALVHGANIGLPAIIDEISWLFADRTEARTDMHASDGCD